MKDRFIGENVRLISSVAELYEEETSSWHATLQRLRLETLLIPWNENFYSKPGLETMNFGPAFQKWFHNQYFQLRHE